MNTANYQEYFDRQPEIYEGILDGLRSGLNFNAAAWGVSAGKSLDKLQRAVERRNPWRNEKNRALESLAFSRFAPYAYVEPEYCIDINGERAAYFLANPDLKPKDIDTTGICRSFTLAKQLRKASGSGFFSHIQSLDTANAELYLSEHLAPVLPFFTDAVKEKMAFDSHVEFLRELDSALCLNGAFGTFRLCGSEEQIDDFSHHLADEWMRIVNTNRDDLAKHIVSEQAMRDACVANDFSYVKRTLITSPDGPLDSFFAKTICDYLDLSLAQLFKLLKRYPVLAFENRLCSPVWVRKRLRAVKAARTAEFYRSHGFVHNRAEKVISDQVLADRKHARERNKSTLENTVIYNKEDHEEWLSLADAAGASTSNPENRRTELMIRVKGFEEAAKELKHQGLFLTFTCPSRFHAYHYTGEVNQNWLDAGKPSVRDSHDWLQANWRILTRRLNFHQIYPYGFRFSEPHHDGCEHWHLVLFMPKKQVRQFMRACKAVFLADMPDEPGAKKRRVVVKYCDPKKGSAVGYCAAYVAKNIDGKALDSITDVDPLTGDNVTVSNDVTDMIQRVDAWRSAYRIRQFQQIGGPTVQAYRELRRCRNVEFIEENAYMFPEFKDLTTGQWFALEHLRLAAENYDWAEFCKAMGGVQVRRKDQTIRIAYRTAKAWNTVTAELNDELYGDKMDEVRSQYTQFGDLAAAQIGGFIFAKLTYMTRRTEWKTESKEFWMKSIREQFDRLIDENDYYAMAQAEYEAYQQMIDQELSERENALVFSECDSFDLSRFEPVDDIYELLESPLSDRYVLVSEGGGAAADH